MGLGFLSSQSSINLFFVTVHQALYEDLIPYVHVAHDLESLVRSTVLNQRLPGSSILQRTANYNKVV
jgi:hypothetical protein